MKAILSDWHFMRILRLLLGAAFLVEAYNQRSWSIALAAGILILMSLVNVGCGSSCSLPQK